MKALFLIAEDFDDIQFFVPYFRLREGGGTVTIVSPDEDEVVGQHGYVITPDMPIQNVTPSDYDVLVIPGGRSPERLRLNEEAVDLTRTFAQDGTPVAAIGHGPQLLISAGAIDGKAVTCEPGIRDDVRGAGGTYQDEDVVVDGGLITARGTDELHLFCESIVAAVAARSR
ncbi:MAG TPA: type 1 glutamine amidotransferase domain-containing protein [Gemmataceae bacterium]|jgi:protease I|nr:type 1 glutamine amidotransferase domain-containing protein [Gemmataceae bacterium]